jgi:hypothetical protein
MNIDVMMKVRIDVHPDKPAFCGECDHLKSRSGYQASCSLFSAQNLNNEELVMSKVDELFFRSFNCRKLTKEAS